MGKSGRLHVTMSIRSPVIFKLWPLFWFTLVPFIGYMICKYFLPFCGLPFHSVNCDFWCMEVFNFVFFFLKFLILM